jgi:hypothetical protein
VAVALSLPWLLARINQPMVAARAGMLIVLASGLGTLPAWQRELRDNAGNIFDQQIAIARWVNQNLPNDAVLAVNDIGALTYYTDRLIFDLAGLASPQVIETLADAPPFTGFADDDLAEMIIAKGCTHAIFYPQWYPVLANRGDVLQRMTTFVLPNNTICGSSIVYACQVRPPKMRAAAIAG